MNCEHCKELLFGRERTEAPELEAEVAANVAAHLRTCASCAQASAALRELNTLLDLEVTASPGLRRQTLARLEQEAAQRKTPAGFAALFAQLWPSRPLGAFSYSLVLVLCGVFGGQFLPGGMGANFADIPTERLYQLCPVPDSPRSNIL